MARPRSLRQIMLNNLVIRLQSVVEYLHQPVPAESLASAASIADAPAGVAPGQVTEIESEEELDGILRADKRPTVLLAGFTWCRPCKVSRMRWRAHISTARMRHQSVVLPFSSWCRMHDRWNSAAGIFGRVLMTQCVLQSLQNPFSKLAEKYTNVKFVKFYGEALLLLQCFATQINLDNVVTLHDAPAASIAQCAFAVVHKLPWSRPASHMMSHAQATQTRTRRACSGTGCRRAPRRRSRCSTAPARWGTRTPAPTRPSSNSTCGSTLGRRTARRCTRPTSSLVGLHRVCTLVHVVWM